MAISGDRENPSPGRSYWTDPYARELRATVTGRAGADGVILDCAVFYAEGGGQPGDVGILEFGGTRVDVVATEVGPGGEVVLRLGDPALVPEVGAAVLQRIDWDRRHRHMRVHTALHLLTVVLPFPVTGGQIAADKGRLDFSMPAAPGDKAEVEDRLNALASRDLPVSSEWILPEVLAAHPDLVKTRSVGPPASGGRVRLVRIGAGDGCVDLQPCGGTHVARTGEIGVVRLGKIENKGGGSRRVTITLP